jgi:PTH1 family peptidyl-tRNA hydrolase
MFEVKMVAGLGNPGKEYDRTRHNVGFRVIDVLAKVLHIEVRRRRFGAVLGLGEFAGKRLILLKPWRLMNRSGGPVATAMGFYKLAVSDLLVIADDMALEPGRIRIRPKGSSGGHNGLADVIEKLGTENIGRLRIGIGPSDREDAADFVLDRPTEPEKPLIDEAVLKASEAVLCCVQFGIETAMNKFN